MANNRRNYSQRPISIVVPLYNEEDVIDELYRRLSQVLKVNGINYEIIFVNDGSTDATVFKVEAICKKNPNVKLISFSRNFGHQIAITAGIDYAIGEAVIVMDADLQDPPEVLPEMLKKWKDGYDVVYGIREVRRGETFFKLFTAKLFYRILKMLTAVEIPVDCGDFRLMDRCVVTQLRNMRERARFVRGMVSWVGFRQAGIKYKRDPRCAGETKYPLKRMIRFALDGIISFSYIPLKIASLFGFFCSGISFIFLVYGIIIKIFYPDNAIPGWASMFTAFLFIGGVQLICLGIIGEYIGRIYEETKERPLYIIDQKINFT